MRQYHAVDEAERRARKRKLAMVVVAFMAAGWGSGLVLAVWALIDPTAADEVGTPWVTVAIVLSAVFHVGFAVLLVFLVRARKRILRDDPEM